VFWFSLPSWQARDPAASGQRVWIRRSRSHATLAGDLDAAASSRTPKREEGGCGQHRPALVNEPSRSVVPAGVARRASAGASQGQRPGAGAACGAALSKYGSIRQPSAVPFLARVLLPVSQLCCAWRKATWNRRLVKCLKLTTLQASRAGNCSTVRDVEDAQGVSCGDRPP
jgi:hypothetical protein